MLTRWSCGKKTETCCQIKQIGYFEKFEKIPSKVKHSYISLFVLWGIFSFLELVMVYVGLCYRSYVWYLANEKLHFSTKASIYHVSIQRCQHTICLIRCLLVHSWRNQGCVSHMFVPTVIFKKLYFHVKTQIWTQCFSDHLQTAHYYHNG